jgi:DNA-binding HxlR family transcriptional regulator
VKTRRTINAKHFVKDIRSHMTEAELMDKYRLSARGLESVLKKLLEAGLITKSEYDWRPGDYEDTVTLDLDFLWKDL